MTGCRLLLALRSKRKPPWKQTHDAKRSYLSLSDQTERPGSRPQHLEIPFQKVKITRLYSRQAVEVPSSLPTGHNEG